MNSILIAKNIIKRVFKGPREIAALILLPVILISIMVVALKGSSNSEPKAGIVQMDSGFIAEKVIEYIKSSNVELVKLNEKNYISYLNSKKISFAVVIPKNFTNDIVAGKKTGMDFYSKDTTGTSIEQSLNRYIQSLYTVSETADLIASKNGMDKTRIYNDLIDGIEKEQFNVEYKLAGRKNGSNEGLIVNPAVGFAVMFMMILIFTTIGIILEDKKKLTLARMFVSPVREWEIIAGNLLGGLAIGVVQLIPLVIALKISFDISSIYKVAGLFVILICFLIAIIGIGIGISGFIKNSLNPTTIIAAVVTPTCILGGCFIPDSMMPDFLNKIGYIVPQKWVMGALQSVLGGESLQSVALNLIIILMFGIAFATFGLKTLRPLNE